MMDPTDRHSTLEYKASWLEKFFKGTWITCIFVIIFSLCAFAGAIWFFWPQISDFFNSL